MLDSCGYGDDSGTEAEAEAQSIQNSTVRRAASRATGAVLSACLQSALPAMTVSIPYQSRGIMRARILELAKAVV